jgi:hypothetical protein
MVWVSKLQTETALSTMEAEIIELAHCCLKVFPVIDIVKELGVVVGMETDKLVSMHVSIHEDNAGALVLAETIPPQFTPRSKYYAIKTVWFREEIQKCGMKLLKIDTIEQLGDIFTKGLARAPFEYLRLRIGPNLSSRGSVDICRIGQIYLNSFEIGFSQKGLINSPNLLICYFMCFYI